MSQAAAASVAEESLSALIARQHRGYTLDRAFYADPQIYRRDIERVFLRCWLYAGHASQIPEAGDFFRFEIAEESIIVVRGRDERIRALVNVCRHRGSRVCWEARGRARTFVCPYHGWAYGLDGALRSARLMPEDFDKSQHALRAIQVEVFHGCIFVSFADDPVPFDGVRRDLDGRLAPFRMDRTKVAASEVYRIDANWKLAVENFLECYHCAPAHPEFSCGHSIKLPRAQLIDLQSALAPRAEAAGLSADVVDETPSKDRLSGPLYYYDRYPLFEGYVTGSEDGRPLAPLLGEIADFDGGASNLQIGPVTYFLAYSDHVVVYRFTPRALQETDCEIVWLVRDDAEEGRDYDVDRLVWLWHVTTEADKTIIEHNQQGVNSRYYRPGPYAPMEDFAVNYLDWYLATIR